MKKNDNLENNIEKERSVPASPKTAKLPTVFRKKYSEKNLNHKLLNKIYISDDREFVRSFFYITDKTRRGTDLYSIPTDIQISKNERTRLVLISKEIKTQKGRIKWLPLAVVAGFILLISVLFTTFKNRIIKNAIQNTCESIFKAKCDIDYVNFKLFDASFRLGGLQIANKDEPMKNLIQIDKIVFDFDLSQLLRLRFITDEVSVDGVATNTDRTYSGDISAKLAAKLAKKQAKKQAKAAKRAEESAFMKSIHSHTDGAIASVKNSVTNLIDSYNPKTVVEKSIAEMTTLEEGKKIEEDVKILGDKWSQKPDEIKIKLESAKDSYEKVINFDYKKIKDDPVQLASAINEINEAYNQSLILKTETESLLDDVKNDSESVKEMAVSLEQSIQHDKDVISSVIDRYKSINLSTGKYFISGTLSNAGYQLLGKYYPYAVQIVNYLIELKNTNKAKNKKTEKEIMNSMLGDRSPGRTVYFRKNPPKFWIKKISASGKIGTDFAFAGKDISSNMDQTGKPAEVDFSITLGDSPHSASLIVDCRSYSQDPIVYIDYACQKLPVLLAAKDYGAEGVPGVPSFNADSDFDCNLKIYENEGFSLTGSGNFKNLQINAEPFEPDYLYSIYSDVLGRVNQINLSATAGYTQSDGVDLRLDTDADDKFIDSLLVELNIQLEKIKEEAEQIVVQKINEYTNGALGEINSFDDIYSKLKEYGEAAKTLESQLEQKKKEFETTVTSKVEETKTEIKEQAENSAEIMTETVKETAKKKAQDYLNGLIK